MFKALTLADLIAAYKTDPDYLEDDKQPWVMAEDEVKKLILERPDDAAHVLSHLLTERKLLEHGGSVGGSWLTKWGEQIVDGGSMGEDGLSDD